LRFFYSICCRLWKILSFYWIRLLRTGSLATQVYALSHINIAALDLWEPCRITGKCLLGRLGLRSRLIGTGQISPHYRPHIMEIMCGQTLTRVKLWRRQLGWGRTSYRKEGEKVCSRIIVCADKREHYTAAVFCRVPRKNTSLGEVGLRSCSDSSFCQKVKL
jgi:hypothetical protein